MKKLFLLAFIWGWSFLFIKVAVGGMTPSMVAFARIALGAAVLHLVLRTRHERLPRDWVSWRHFAVVATFGSVVPFTMLAWGEERITSALTAVLNASTPIFTALAAVAILRERLRPVHAAGLLLGLVGVAVAAGLGSDDLDGASIAGSLAAVGAGACYGVAFAYTRKHFRTTVPVVAACGQLTAGTILLAPFALGTSAVEGIDLTGARALSVALLGLVCTGAAYVINHAIIREAGATRASLVTYLIPAVAVAVGVAVLREPFHITLLLGAVLIVGSVAIVHDRLPARWLVRPPAGPAAVVAVALLGAALVGACADDDGGSEGAGCGPSRREALDPNFLVHVLPDAPDVTYLSDPPTSGPHQPSPPVSGVVDGPLSRPVQVGLLEAGAVLIQYRPDAGEAVREAVTDLARDGVVVAPNADLADPVVATAWQHKRSCSSADVAALEAFIDDHDGDEPALHD